MQEEMSNRSRKMEILRIKKKCWGGGEEMLEIKNTVTEIKNVFELIRLHMAKERTSELEDISVEISKTEKQRFSTCRNCDNYKCVMGKERERERSRSNI